MWNDGKYLLWRHIFDFYKSDLENGLRLLPRLSAEHVKLSSYSTMRVDLAAQVLSESVGKVLSTYGSSDVQATAEFCLHIDKFFDCANVRSTTEGCQSLKDFRKPFSSKDDERFSWLEDDFLGYLARWKSNIDAREGFSEKEKSRMFLYGRPMRGYK